MAFKSNQSEAFSRNNLKPTGDYECIVGKIEERVNKNGKESLNVLLVIRNDVEQGYKNGFIFHQMWKRKQPTELDNQVKGYSFSQIMTLGKACGLPDGKEYESLEQFCNELINKPVRVTLTHQEWNGQTQERVDWLNVTKFPDVKHVKKSSASNVNNTYASQQSGFASPTQKSEEPLLADEDLPF